MYCERDKRECSSFFCKGKCWHDKIQKQKDEKKTTFRGVDKNDLSFQVSDYGKSLVEKYPPIKVIQKSKTKPVNQSQSAEEGIDCYVHNTICHSVLCEQNGCRASVNSHSLPVKKNKKQRNQRWKGPSTMKEKTEDEKPELVFAQRLKKAGECTKCGHYKPCLARCYPVMLKSGKVIKP